MNFRGERRRRDVAMDLTPMIDVVFILLIFFLVTASFTQQDRHLIPILLPEASTGESATEAPVVTVTVSGDDTLTLTDASDESVVLDSTARLAEELRYLRANHDDLVVRLRGDQTVSYGRIMEVWDTAREVGVTRVENEVFRP